jgi:methyl-accepting chemotaxis protein
MSQPPSNDVLAEQIRKLREDFNDFKKETRVEVRELDDKVDKVAEVSSRVDQALGYMRENVAEMKNLMTGFTNIVSQQNEQIDKNIRSQNDKIDAFISSDKRAMAKTDLIVSVLTAIGSIIVALLTLWASGKL